jgi:hypothetical protein
MHQAFVHWQGPDASIRQKVGKEREMRYIPGCHPRCRCGKKKGPCQQAKGRQARERDEPVTSQQAFQLRRWAVS